MGSNKCYCHVPMVVTMVVDLAIAQCLKETKLLCETWEMTIYESKWDIEANAPSTQSYQMQVGF